MVSRQRFLSGFIIIFFQIFISSASATSLLLSTFAGPPLSTKEGRGFYDVVLQEAFSRIGISIEIVELPAERSLKNANDGITDGDFVRIAGLSTLYPGLIRVPEKITDFEFVGFTKNQAISVSGWKDLEPYDVAIVRGWKILEGNIVKSRSLVRTKNQRLLFTLLKNDRVDIVIYSRFEGYEMVKQFGLDNVKVLDPSFAVREMFLYLNKKHASLVPGIAKVLAEMKADGSFAVLREKTLSQYLDN